jgi:hypothetical protein
VQTLPQAPQLLTSLLKSTQAPLHRLNPELQKNPHEPLKQVGDAFAGTGHAAPHPPQFAGSFEKFGQAPLHRGCVPPHLHRALTQLDPDGHTLPQPPQFDEPEITSMHVCVPHRLEPKGQVCPHAPPVQVALPPVGTGQRRPQLPQLFGSV